jgi:GNAT superfamily N-acetyltransferase
MGVREYTTGDLSSVRAMMGELNGRELADFDPRTVRQGWKSIVYDDPENGIVGFLLGSFVDYGIAHEGGGMIEQLVVTDLARNHGVGSELVSAWQQWLGDEGIALGFVPCEEGSEAARFYESRGFTACKGPWLVWSEATHA